MNRSVSALTAGGDGRSLPRFSAAQRVLSGVGFGWYHGSSNPRGGQQACAWRVLATLLFIAVPEVAKRRIFPDILCRLRDQYLHPRLGTAEQFSKEHGARIFAH